VAQRQADAVVPVQLIPVSARVANAVVSYGWYLEKTFWPTDLAAYYAHPLTQWTWGPVLRVGTALLAITLGTVLLAPLEPWLLVGWLWFVGTLVPVVGLVQVGEQARADRFVYVPHIGLLTGLVWTAADLLVRLRVPAVVQGGLAGASVAALAVGTTTQVTYWHETESLWRHALAVDPDNHRAHSLLGRHLASRAVAASDIDALAEARSHFEAAVAVRPNVEEYEFGYGLLLMYEQELGAAAERYQKALSLLRKKANFAEKELYADTLHNLGYTRLRQGKLAEAEKCLREALEVRPQVADTRAMLGQVLWELDRRTEAAQEWEEALRESPHEPEALIGVGQTWLWKQRYADAARALREAVRLKPESSRARSLLGLARGRDGHAGEAVGVCPGGR
jgi:cytochrome c-type biogenesis protein CcmH/NrfG